VKGRQTECSEKICSLVAGSFKFANRLPRHFAAQAFLPMTVFKGYKICLHHCRSAGLNDLYEYITKTILTFFITIYNPVTIRDILLPGHDSLKSAPAYFYIYIIKTDIFTAS
jgi:hypothetical protein